MMIDHAWEYDKENIKPLVGGRRAVLITGSANIEDDSKFFEEKILLSDDSELVTNWYHYITWYEQKCLTGGKSFYELLERCLQSIPFEKQNFNIKYYTRIWIKYAELSDNNLEIYKFMFSCGIGLKLIDFYTSWSRVLEVSGFIIQALEVMKIAFARKIDYSGHIKICIRSLENRLDQLRSGNIRFDETGLSLPNQEEHVSRKVFADLLKKCKYEQSMDRATNSSKADPYKTREDVYSSLSHRQFGTNNFDMKNIFVECDDQVVQDQPQPLHDPWVAPYISSRIGADNKIPSLQSLGKPTKTFGPRDTKEEEKSTTEIYIYNEEWDAYDEPKNNDASSMLTSSVITKDSNSRIFLFKRSKMPAYVKTRLKMSLKEREAASKLPVVSWIISPVIDYSTNDKEYSFEELVAARLKKKLQKK